MFFFYSIVCLNIILPFRSGRNNFNMMSNDFNQQANYNYYGLSASFLESLGITGPLHNKVFVANVSIVIDISTFYQTDINKSCFYYK